MLEKRLSTENLGLADAIELLEIENYSEDYYRLLSRANQLSRAEFGTRGYIFGQIGINAAPCSGNCKFCSLANSHFTVRQNEEKSIDTVVLEAQEFVKSGVSDVFLMTTADFSKQTFLAYGRAVQAILPTSVRLVANVGDFERDYAKQLKAAGFTGVYHIVRLGEGVDTDLPVALRETTIESAIEEGLELYYCVEPIGPEHTYLQIATEMLRAKKYHVQAMAVMKRIAVVGSPLFSRGEISSCELLKIAAVARLVTRPMRSMNIHEPLAEAPLAGVNQLYAECGVNPRDNDLFTEQNRGFSAQRVSQMLANYDYHTEPID